MGVSLNLQNRSLFLFSHGLLQYTGEGLGSSRSGISDPIVAGGVKKDNLGVGASNPGEVTPEDDIYEQYKKRMMLGYRYRPNPLVIREKIVSFIQSIISEQGTDFGCFLSSFCRIILGKPITENQPYFTSQMSAVINLKKKKPYFSILLEISVFY